MIDNKYIIGIDCGVNTGFAVWDGKTFREVSTQKIHVAMDRIKEMHYNGVEIFVRVEDARKRKWFGKAGRETLQGAGSIKRDSTIWEDFLTYHGIPHEMVAPKNNKTKLDKARFTKYTGFVGRTSEHSRDAAMLVFNYSPLNLNTCNK